MHVGNYERWPKYYRIPSNGVEFERYIATLLSDIGFEVSMTPATNDYGADIVAVDPLDKKTICIQAKFYSSQLDNSPIQEVCASKAHYSGDEAWVITNSSFSNNAKQLAKDNSVLLIDNDLLNRLIDAVVSGDRSILPSFAQLDDSGRESSKILEAVSRVINSRYGKSLNVCLFKKAIELAVDHKMLTPAMLQIGLATCFEIAEEIIDILCFLNVLEDAETDFDLAEFPWYSNYGRFNHVIGKQRIPDEMISSLPAKYWRCNLSRDGLDALKERIDELASKVDKDENLPGFYFNQGGARFVGIFLSEFELLDFSSETGCENAILVVPGYRESPFGFLVIPYIDGYHRSYERRLYDEGPIWKYRCVDSGILRKEALSSCKLLPKGPSQISQFPAIDAPDALGCSIFSDTGYIDSDPVRDQMMITAEELRSGRTIEEPEEEVSEDIVETQPSMEKQQRSSFFTRLFKKS